MSRKDHKLDAGAAKENKPGRLTRYVQTAKRLHAEPKSIGPMMREALVRVWSARGGGFYGLGYVVAFIVIEVRMFTGEILDSSSVAGFALAQIFEYAIRVSFLSFINVFLAFVWPVYVLNFAGGYGIAALLLGYIAFEKLLRPVVESHFPELVVVREQRERKKGRKAEARGRPRARKAENAQRSSGAAESDNDE